MLVFLIAKFQQTYLLHFYWSINLLKTKTKYCSEKLSKTKYLKPSYVEEIMSCVNTTVLHFKRTITCFKKDPSLIDRFYRRQFPPSTAVLE